VLGFARRLVLEIPLLLCEEDVPLDRDILVLGEAGMVDARQRRAADDVAADRIARLGHYPHAVAHVQEVLEATPGEEDGVVLYDDLGLGRGSRALYLSCGHPFRDEYYVHRQFVLSCKSLGKLLGTLATHPRVCVALRRLHHNDCREEPFFS